jgi:hypothetical protein
MMIHVSSIIQFYKSIHRMLRWLSGHHVKMCCSRVILIIVLRYEKWMLNFMMIEVALIHLESIVEQCGV